MLNCIYSQYHPYDTSCSSVGLLLIDLLVRRRYKLHFHAPFSYHFQDEERSPIHHGGLHGRKRGGAGPRPRDQPEEARRHQQRDSLHHDVQRQRRSPIHRGGQHGRTRGRLG